MHNHKYKLNFLFGLLLFLPLFHVNKAMAVSLTEIQQIANTGAVDLSERILQREQPQLKTRPEEWMAWEKQRIKFYSLRKQWPQIAERLQTLPDFVDAEFIFWAKTERAEALIKLHRGEVARSELRGLIWSLNAEKRMGELVTRWRRLIIKSYLADGLAADASMASLRLQQDIREPDPESAFEDTLVRARIAILNHQEQEAIRLLKPYSKNIEAAVLILLAELRGQIRSPGKVLETAYKYLHDKNTAQEYKANLWAVVAEVAQRMGRRGTRTNALEHVLVNRKNLSLDESIYKIDSDSLWNAYVDYAVQISNEEQLLIGEDQKWLDVAERIKKKKPVGARAMAVFVMLRSRSDKSREQASAMFTAMLKKRKSASKLLTELFKNSNYYSATDKIPVSVRHVLVDIALNNSDIDRASELMATIKEPPEGADNFMWWLRRARILVLGNQAEVGAQALHDLLDKNKELKQEQIDKLLQVVFDLQAAGKQELAYGLFERVLGYTSDQQVQREIYYWMADSRKSQKRYVDAAQLYLKSAMHPDPQNMDPWAQTAHYQAAESLARAGLYADATTLFRRLLKVTDDPARRATLQRELHRLWAMQ